MQLSLSEGTRQVLATVMGSAATITILGNVVVVVVFLHRPALRNIRSNLFIISLGFTDFLTGLITMPLNMDFHLNDQLWRHGDCACLLWLLADMVLCTASVWNLAAIAIDRMMAVVYPVVYMKLRHRSAVLVLLGVWCLSLLICLPPFLGQNQLINYDKCQIWSVVWFDVYSSLGAFFAPLAIVVVCYAVIACKLYVKMKQRKLKSMELKELAKLKEQNAEAELKRQGMLSAATSTSLIAAVTAAAANMGSSLAMQQEPQQQQQEQQQQQQQQSQKQQGRYLTVIGNNQASSLSSPKISIVTSSDSPIKTACNRERRVLVQMSVIVAVFVLCWLPFWLFYVSLGICLRLETCSYHEWFHGLALSLQWLGYFNSLLNPLLYSIFNAEFRRAFWQLAVKNKHCTRQ